MKFVNMPNYKVISSKTKVRIHGELPEYKNSLNPIAEKYEIHPNFIHTHKQKLLKATNQLLEKKIKGYGIKLGIELKSPRMITRINNK